MKVLIVAFGHPDNVLSLSKHLSSKVDLTIAFHLNGDFYQQGVLHFNHESLEPGIYKNPEIINRYLPKEVTDFVAKDFKIWFFKTKSLKILRDKWLENLRIVIKVSRAIKKGKYDVLHFNGTSGFFMYYRMLFWNKTIVWTLHDYKPHTGEDNLWHEFQTKWILKSSLVVIQHYKYLAKSIIEYYAMPKDKVVQIYSGTFDILKSFGEKKLIDETNYFLFFGRISKYKGVKYLIEAFKMLPVPRPKLVIAGQGKIEAENLPEDIILINRYLETEELNFLIKNCLCVVAPYTDATHSGTIMSAYTYSKPVISSDVNGISEVVVERFTGFLVEPKNADKLSMTMFNFYTTQGLSINYDQNIVSYLATSNVAWESCIEELLKLYTRITCENEI